MYGRGRGWRILWHLAFDEVNNFTERGGAAAAGLSDGGRTVWRADGAEVFVAPWYLALY